MLHLQNKYSDKREMLMLMFRIILHYIDLSGEELSIIVYTAL